MTSAFTDAAAVEPPGPVAGATADPEITVVQPEITVIASDDLTVLSTTRPAKHRLMRVLVVLGLAAAVVLTTLAMLTARQTPSSSPPPSVAPAGATPLQPVPAQP